MPGLIRARAVGPAAKTAKSCRAGLRARQWGGLWCAVRTRRQNFSEQLPTDLCSTRKL